MRMVWDPATWNLVLSLHLSPTCIPLATLRLSAVGYCIPLCTGMEYHFSEKIPAAGLCMSFCMVAGETPLAKSSAGSARSQRTDVARALAPRAIPSNHPSCSSTAPCPWSPPGPFLTHAAAARGRRRGRADAARTGQARRPPEVEDSHGEAPSSLAPAHPPPPSSQRRQEARGR